MSVSASTMDEVVVQVGGHVTLLFSVHSQALLSRNQGSRGAGFCLEEGVEVSVRKIPGEEDRITVSQMDGSLFDEGNFLYVDLLEAFREVFKVSEAVEMNVDLELPVSQGFGMSAAGLLAASLALGELFDKGDDGQLARLAHRLERIHSGGLGDVLGLWAGGCELRIKPGSPPAPGKVLGFDVGCKALLVWVPEGSKHTSGYIDDPQWKESITLAGDSAVDRLMAHDWNSLIWPTLLEEADRFALESGLLEEVERATLLDTVQSHLDDTMSCHLCMLGTSLIIVPRKLGYVTDFDDLSSRLRGLGLGVRLTGLQ